MKTYEAAVVESILIHAARYRNASPPRNPLGVKLMPEELRAVARYVATHDRHVFAPSSVPGAGAYAMHVAGCALVEVTLPPPTVESRFLFQDEVLR